MTALLSGMRFVPISAQTGEVVAIVDAHHHLWDLNALRYPWLQGLLADDGTPDAIQPLRRDYLIDHFLADSKSSGVVKSVHVQAECDPTDPVAETRWLQAIADVHGFPQGIVAFVALNQDDAQATIEGHCQHRNMRGVRQMLNRNKVPALGETDRANYLTDAWWRRGFSLLARFDLSFDLHIYPWQMDDAASLADEFADTRIALNHLGLPLVRDEAGLREWRRGMQRLARRNNVAVKLSGLAMLDHTYAAASIRPLLIETIEIFGPGRCMFGSNYPVDRPHSGYSNLVSTFLEAITTYSPMEQRLMLHDNAITFYRLA